MLVGIIDYDLFTSEKSFTPNPDVMLISAYHKKRGDIVHLLLNGKDMQVYDKVYLRKEKKSSKQVPRDLINYPGLDIGGRFFSNNRVFTLPDEYYKNPPDVSIYDKYFRYLKDNKIKGQTKFLNSSFISLKREETLKSSLRNTFIYDHDLGSLEDFNKLEELYKNGLFRKLNCCYPIHCNSLELVQKWSTAEWLHRETEVYYENTVSLGDLQKIKGFNARTKITAYITNKNRFFGEKEIQWEVIQGVNKTLFCIINQVPVTLNLPPTFRNSPEKLLIEDIARWNYLYIQPSFKKFCCTTASRKALYEKLIKEYPEHEMLFEIEPHELKKKGGVWHYDRV